MKSLAARWTLALAAVSLVWTVRAQELRLPNASGSVKFAVIGDTGTGDRQQYQTADQMAKLNKIFKFDRVIMLGDNIYGGQTAQDLDLKFTKPYKALVDAGVDFYASLGNHDSQNNRNFGPFHMAGQRYYTFETKKVRFFALDTDQLDPQQLAWFENALKASEAAKDEWKIVYFHHPIYSSGGRHGSDMNLRVVLEPLFVTYNVNLVFAGHDHIYERVNPQKGIYYFVVGSTGQLRKGDYRKQSFSATGYDDDMVFLLVEIVKAEMSFQAVTRTGQIVDSGKLPLQVRPAS
jgi:hypothetical protein